MQRLRKNSLSPCYTAANKENLPIDNLTSPIGISFKNLQQARKKKTIQPSSSQAINPKMSLNQYFFKQTPTPTNTNTHTNTHTHTNSYGNSGMDTGGRKEGKVMESARREHDKSIEDFRSSLKSKQKQMSSLHSQVNTLSSTITLLKQQITTLKTQNTALTQQNSQYKKTQKEQSELIQKLKKQKQEAMARSTSPITHRTSISNNNNNKPTIPTPIVPTCTKCKDGKGKDQEYDQVIEKLNQLEEVQDRLLSENQRLTKKDIMYKAMFRNFRTLIDANRIHQLADLINVLNQ